MRVELDKPLTKTKLRQILKMAGKDGKEIKVIMGTEIFNIDTVVSKGDSIYLCTDGKQTSDFYEKKVNKDKDVTTPFYDNKIFTVTYDEYWDEKWEKYRKAHNLPKYYVGDTPSFNDDIT